MGVGDIDWVNASPIFSSDSQQLMFPGGDRVAVVDVNGAALVSRACQKASRSLSPGEIRRYLQNLPVAPCAPAKPVPDTEVSKVNHAAR